MGAFDPGGEREPDGRGRGQFARRLLSSGPGSDGEMRPVRRRLRYAGARHRAFEQALAGLGHRSD